MSQHGDSAKISLITKKIGFAVLACTSVLFAGACGSAGNGPASTASDAPSLSGAKSPVAEPTFTYPGGPQCKITYRDNGNDTMSWTADVTVTGELITHASDTSGNINRHDEQVIVGLNTFTAQCRSHRSPTSAAFYTFRMLPLRLRTAARSRRNGSRSGCPASSAQCQHSSYATVGTGRAARSVGVKPLSRRVNISMLPNVKVKMGTRSVLPFSDHLRYRSSAPLEGTVMPTGEDHQKDCREETKQAQHFRHRLHCAGHHRNLELRWERYAEWQHFTNCQRLTQRLARRLTQRLARRLANCHGLLRSHHSTATPDNCARRRAVDAIGLLPANQRGEML